MEAERDDRPPVGDLHATVVVRSTGMEWTYRGLENHTTRAGTWTQLAVMETRCRACGEPFEVRVPSRIGALGRSKSLEVVHCPAHRRAPAGGRGDRPAPPSRPATARARHGVAGPQTRTCPDCRRSVDVVRWPKQCPGCAHYWQPPQADAW
jgi:hypothetical protein